MWIFIMIRTVFFDTEEVTWILNLLVTTFLIVFHLLESLCIPIIKSLFNLIGLLYKIMYHCEKPTWRLAAYVLFSSKHCL